MRFAAGQVAQCKTNSFPFVLGVRSLPLHHTSASLLPSLHATHTERTQLNSADNASDRQHDKSTIWKGRNMQYAAHNTHAGACQTGDGDVKRKQQWKRKWWTLSSIALKPNVAWSLEICGWANVSFAYVNRISILHSPLGGATCPSSANF